jgi:hypothetical protein
MAIQGQVKEISRRERRARLGQRHYLSEPAEDATHVANRLVAIHSSDPATVYLTMWARVRDFVVADLEKLLYEERSLVRHWAMRRTLWVVERETLPLVVSASTRPIGEKERRRTVKLIEAGGVASDGEAWLELAIEKTLEMMHANGEVLARQLSNAVPELAEKVEFRNKAGKLMGTTGMSSRTLLQLGIESRVLRARPAGSWISGQYRWAVTQDWLGGPIADVPMAEASARIIESWLAAFGPASEADMRWWTGWPVNQVRAAIDEVGAVEVDLGDDGPGYVLPDDLDDVPEPEPWAALLPSLDSTVMGWKERSWYLGAHEQSLFDRNGNAGPTVWVDGRIVGGWTITDDGEVRHEVFEDIGSEAASRVESKCHELEGWLDGTSVTPRFRSPHDKSLAS